MLGLPPSRLHSALEPFSPGTSSWIQQWGLVHWNCFTVPVIDT